MKALRRTCAVAIAIFPSLVYAQNPLRSVVGASKGESVGMFAGRYSDVDADGIGEYLVGYARGIRIYRGSDGALLGDVRGAQGVIGDIDGDGWLDFWSAMRDGSNGEWTSTEVLSGASGALLAQWPWLQTPGPYGTTYGAPIAFDDVDGDGHDDFLRADRVAHAPRVVIVSGLDASLLRSHDGDIACTALNDVDGDGVRDYFLTGGIATSPALVSGASGAILGLPAFPVLQSVMGATGDVDGDGANDIAYVDYYGSWPPPTIVVSSITGAVLQTLPEIIIVGPDNQTPHGDFDGDHVDDLVLRDLATAELVVRSMVSGAVVQRYDLLSYAMTAIDDLDGDGREELLVGVSHAKSSMGKAMVLTGAYSERVGTPFGFGDGTSGPCPCALSPQPGAGCANSLGIGARLMAWGSPSLTARDLLLFEQGTWRDAGLLGRSYLLVSAAPAATPQPFQGGLLALNQPKQRIAKTRLWWWDAPSLSVWNSWAASQTVYLQSWYREGNPAGACGATGNLTNALAITFTP